MVHSCALIAMQLEQQTACILHKLSHAKLGTHAFHCLLVCLQELQTAHANLTKVHQFLESITRTTEQLAIVQVQMNSMTLSAQPNHAPTIFPNELTQIQKCILQDWANAHLLFPYPSAAEKERLAERAHLAVQQVTTWFANYRRRKWAQDLCTHMATRELEAWQKEALQSWAEAHIRYPFPSCEEKEALARQANLSQKQVADWFANFRRRKWESYISIIVNAA